VLELDLVADLDELFCDEILAFIAMERQQYWGGVSIRQSFH
jgi:hypothetical protein